MKNLIFRPSVILIIIVTGILTAGCAYQRYIKTALKYEEAGMYKPAADNYLLSLKKKSSKNDKAKIGLMRSSKRYYDETAASIDDYYNNRNDNQVVKLYLEMEALQQQMGRYNITIDIPARTSGQYREAKERYLREAYTNAQELIDRELFDEAAFRLEQIIKIDKAYERASELFIYSKSEPIYRKANQCFQQNLFRSAYRYYNQVLSYDPNFKDAPAMMKLALSNALLTIAIQPPKNERRFPTMAGQIESKIKSKFESGKNPFLRIVSLNYTQQMLEEQKKALANNLPFDASRIIPVRVYLNSSVNSSNYIVSQLKEYEKKAYLRYTDNNRQVRYKKIKYYEYEQSCQLSMAYTFEFARVEDAAILASSSLERTLRDEIYYAKSEYKTDDLFPGEWGVGVKDTVYTDATRKNNLTALFAKRTKLLSRMEMESSFAELVAIEVYKRIDAYDPEKITQ
ncbi:MAG: hypothetical protein VB102_11800 [Paludibacter sp.]|nr:hypothetical protein [Paludibacter sp.]